MTARLMTKIKYQLFLLGVALRKFALLTLLDYWMYRSPLKLAWKRLRGHRFHKSSIIWFAEGPDVHTRVIVLLPRLRVDYPHLRSIDMDLEFFDEAGRSQARWRIPNADLKKPFILESDHLPADFKWTSPFSGSLLIKQTLHLPDREILKKEGLFGSTFVFFDYYSEKRFIATTHDYCAWLPDQGMSYGDLGMIPAYCDDEKETYLLMHASKPGIAPRDVEIALYNHRGEKKTRRFPGLKPFAMKKAFLSEYFPDAKVFLEGRVGQVVVRGLFRQLLRRMAYGVVDRASGTFSFDHCFYSLFGKKPFLKASEREKIAKGWFDPFLIVENDTMKTHALVFQSSEDKDKKNIDLIIYDSEGKCVLNISPYARLAGDEVARISMRDVLHEHGIQTPFLGHGEALYHKEPDAEHYQNNLDLTAEYERDGRLTSVILGAAPWNPPKEIVNKNYNSGFRIVCDERHTTYLGISNCSYDYDYELNVRFRLNLIAGGEVVASGTFSVPPNGTIYRSIEEFFPNTRDLLKVSRGVGLASITDINCAYLTNLFITEDRASGALSAEHSFDLA